MEQYTASYCHDVLCQDLQNFLDNSPEGVVYLSFGTNVRTNSINDQKRNIILETFAKLPYKVLMKSDQVVSSLPKNVMMMKWVPQQDVLG